MLQEILGHASSTTTLDLYGHLYPGDMDRYANRLDDAAASTGNAKNEARRRERRPGGIITEPCSWENCGALGGRARQSLVSGHRGRVSQDIQDSGVASRVSGWRAGRSGDVKGPAGHHCRHDREAPCQ
jgi:hypothetical protein